MPASLALALALGFIACLWVRDVVRNPGVSHALWIPLAWLLIIGSRFPSDWFSGSNLPDSPDAYLEGSSLDRNVFLGLIVVGFLVLLYRRTSFALFVRNNPWIALFFAYTALSILWSDFPMTAFKRWHKVAGHVIMALIVLTERNPTAAFVSLFKRAAYVLVPISILFIKYIPEYGRGYDRWTGAVINVGITNNKNLLGNMCFIVGLFLVALLFVKRDDTRHRGWLEFSITAVFLGMTLWLLKLSNSATSLACLVLGTGIIAMTRVRFLAKHFTAVVITLTVVLTALQLSIDLKDLIITSLGRDPTLTGRTELWDLLKEVKINPIIGTGFESFWLGERIEYLWSIYWWKPNQAHNGYYETYLNLGLIGLSLQCAMILGAYRKLRQELGKMQAPEMSGSLELALARFCLAYLIALAFYNMTEATFKALHLSFFVFFMVALKYPISQGEAAAVERGPTKRESRNHLLSRPVPVRVAAFADTSRQPRPARRGPGWRGPEIRDRRPAERTSRDGSPRARGRSK